MAALSINRLMKACHVTDMKAKNRKSDNCKLCILSTQSW